MMKRIETLGLLGLLLSSIFVIMMVRLFVIDNMGDRQNTVVTPTSVASRFFPVIDKPLETPSPTLVIPPRPSTTPLHTVTPGTLIAIPEVTDWIDRGIAFSEGVEGEWDRYLWGGFTATAVKKEGVYYLYYQGANGYSDLFETVTWRAIGLATSNDGLHFTKHADNPLVSWSPNNNLEEGAVSAGATLIDNAFYLFYGANTEININLVSADGRLTTASDGVNFTDQGVFLAHTDSSVWGAGDELFPIIAFKDNGRYFIYYIPNGVVQTGQLGVAWGNDLSQLQTAAATSNAQPVTAWGAGGYAKISSDTYALFVNNVRENKTFVYTVSLNEPQKLSAVQQTYEFSNYTQATFLLDQESQTWFMYYRNTGATYYGVKTAPVVTITP